MLRSFVTLLVMCMLAVAQDTRFAPKNQLIPGPDCLILKGAWSGGGDYPCSAKAHADWLADVRHWREERKIRVGYDGSRYNEQALKWTQSSFIQPQMLVHDRYFFDVESGKYTVDRYLDDLEKRYGGIDSVLIWPTYPNMGIDDRNQHDMIRSMPGGISGVRDMIADFHHRHVRVLFPMMMWDQGTRDPNVPWPQAIADLMKEIGADGINGDTQDGVPLAFSQAADRFRWLEPRHMVNISDRWNRSKIDDLQYAFFNGEGWESWENIWGIWNGITPRDSEATRRMATIERAAAAFLVSSDWEPFYPMHPYGVYSSRWPGAEGTLWTIVNRNEYNVDGRQISISHEAGVRYFDLYHGRELTPELQGGTATLSFPLEAHGFGAILAARGPLDEKLQSCLTTMKRLSAVPLVNYSSDWKTTPQQIVTINKTALSSSVPDGMIRIPGGDYTFRVEGIEIEGFDDVGVDVQYPWEDTPRRFHEHRMNVAPYLMDKFPVTNAEFKKFLDASHYVPKDGANFLRDWKNGNYPAGWENKPVTWVSLEDSRAYARWAGKRLPHEWEWQFAAQGPEGRTYPWGNEWRESAVPQPDKDRQLRGPDNADAHPSGASSFGNMDMVGNVWQWTDEFIDEHTRAAIVRGGSYYQPQGSIWYFPQAYRNDQHGKLLLMSPGYDRSGTLGFRCVKDLQ